ncbi:MAG: hypothetical protein OEZ13_11505 [Spirochaetia bacterium]|nr:hypothetical protein [Spirochaetia bacterium]
MKLTKKITFLIFTFLFAFSLNAQETKKRIAVLPFENGEGVTAGEAKYLTERVRSSLISSGRFEVISNDQIENMMKIESKKQGIGPGSCNTEKCLIDLGNALECEKMLVGTAMGAFGEFAINGKILDVVSQQYEKSVDVRIDNKSKFPDAAQEVVNKITDGYDGGESFEVSGPTGPATYMGMIWRSFILPGWGHVYANEKRGYIYMGLYAAVGGAYLWSHFNYASKKDAYDAAGADTVESAYDAANSAMNLRGYLSYTFLAVAATALTDIFITGKNYAGYTSAMQFHNREKFSFQNSVKFVSKNISEEYYNFKIHKPF